MLNFRTETILLDLMRSESYHLLPFEINRRGAIILFEFMIFDSLAETRANLNYLHKFDIVLYMHYLIRL